MEVAERLAARRCRCQPLASARGRRGGPYSSRMFWPLIGGLVAFVLFAVLMGWLMDTDRRGDADRH